ncbi:hypothetical protein [Halobacteriovorax sp.]|uniref:hypothetical protein n=1 Tax=Halobacteriovorax sp. TaxID=2020862 RepID=UPI003564C6ED
MKTYLTGPAPRPNYLKNTSSPTSETKKIWQLSSEVKLINKQTEYIKNNGIKAKDTNNFYSFNNKLNII